MTTVRDIDTLLSSFAPKTLSESWDNDGVMLCRSPEKQIKKVLVMLEVRENGVQAALDGGYDLIVTHHPLIFHPLSSVTNDTYSLLETLMRADIPVLSYHTRLDSAEKGVNSIAAEKLGLTGVTSFGGESGELGRIGTLPEDMTADAFIKHVKAAFGCPAVRASFFGEGKEKSIRRVGVVGGAGKHFVWDALAAGADAYVTSEVSHDVFIDAAKAGIMVVDAGHYYTENPVCERIKSFLDGAFAGLTVDIFDVGTPYLDL